MFLITTLAAALLGIVVLQLLFVLGYLGRMQRSFTSLSYSLSAISQRMETIGNYLDQFDGMSTDVGDIAHRTQEVAEQLQDLAGSIGTDGKKWSRLTFHEQLEEIRKNLIEANSNVAVSVLSSLERIESNTDRLTNRN